MDDLEALLSQFIGMFPNPPEIPPPEMKPIKQAELFKKFRPYIPDEYKTHPIYCAPSDAAVYQVKSDKALARKFKHQGSLQQTGTKRL
jgi:hypothetical protein